MLAIVPYSPHHRAAFGALNRAWVEKYFHVEPEDEAVLSDPETHILAPGGRILMAEWEGNPVGACALLKSLEHGMPLYELAKMAVDEAYQGKGIGRRLGEAVIREAQRLGAEKLWIISNRRLETAIALYHRLGFTESAVNRHHRFQRGDITLERRLERLVAA